LVAYWSAAAVSSPGLLVRHLVRASGGEIILHAHPGGGLDARVRLRPGPTDEHPRRKTWHRERSTSLGTGGGDSAMKSRREA
jgi:hypothetical protein